MARANNNNNKNFPIDGMRAHCIVHGLHDYSYFLKILSGTLREHISWVQSTHHEFDGWLGIKPAQNYAVNKKHVLNSELDLLTSVYDMQLQPSASS